MNGRIQVLVGGTNGVNQKVVADVSDLKAAEAVARLYIGDPRYMLFASKDPDYERTSASDETLSLRVGRSVTFIPWEWMLNG